MKLETLGTCPPTIELGTYVLRPLRPADAPAWYAYLSDPAVTRLTSYDVTSVETVARFIAAYEAGYVERRSNRWAIADKASDLLIGTCGFYSWDTPNARAELGYDLAKAYWGRGIMTEAVRAAVRWAFEQLHVNRIQATVMVGNAGSARVLEKCGFRREGTLRAYKICRGEPRDFWMYAHLSKEYAPAPGT